MKLIKYIFMTEINHGTEEEPNVVQTFNDVEIQCSDETFESNYAIAQREAYSEITVEDILDPVLPPTPEQRIAELEARNTALEDALCELDAMLCSAMKEV